MALPAGRKALFNFKGPQGDKGETGTFADAHAIPVPYDETDLKPILSGPQSAREITFKQPRGLPGFDAVPTDEGIATLLLAPDSATGTAFGEVFSTAVEEPTRRAADIAPYALDKIDDAVRVAFRLGELNRRLRAAKDTKCVIYALGDSITEGHSTGERGNRYQDRLTAMLRAEFNPAGVAGGEGYVPSRYVASMANLPQRWAYTGTATDSDSYGPGLRAKVLSVAATATLTFTGTGVDLWIAGGPGTGQMTYAIDGDTPVVIETATGSVAERIIEIRDLPATGHTLVISNSGASGSLTLSGAYIYNGDENVGVHVIDGGHSGYAAQFSNAHLSAMSVLARPAAFFYFLFTNDTLIRTPASYKLGMQGTISHIAGVSLNLAAPVIGWVPPERGDHATQPTQGAWSEYADKLYELADENENFVVFDAQAVTGGFADREDPLNLMEHTGYIHPNANGHKVIARALFDFIVPRTQRLRYAARVTDSASVPFGPGSLVCADTGQPWTVGAGVWMRKKDGIHSNATTAGLTVATLDPGAMDEFIIRSRILISGETHLGFVFRYKDQSNYLRLSIFRRTTGTPTDGITLFKVSGGTATSLATNAAAGLVDGLADITVRFRGGTVTVVKDGVAVLTHALAGNLAEYAAAGYGRIGLLQAGNSISSSGSDAGASRFTSLEVQPA